MKTELNFIKEKIKNSDFMNFLGKKSVDISAFTRYNFNREFQESSVKSDYFILNEKFKEFELEKFKKKN